MVNRVSLIKTKRNIISVYTDAYWFKPVGRFAWLQKLLWKILYRFGALNSYWEKTTSYERIDVNCDDLLKQLRQSIQEVQYSGRKPKTIYIGASDFEDLVCTTDVYQYMHFNMEDNDRKIYGIHVEILPWMQGILVV